jgi:hypothetical protein
MLAEKNHVFSLVPEDITSVVGGVAIVFRSYGTLSLNELQFYQYIVPSRISKKNEKNKPSKGRNVGRKSCLLSSPGGHHIGGWRRSHCVSSLRDFVINELQVLPTYCPWRDFQKE